MIQNRSRNTARYYIFIVFALAFFFFTSDFGLIDVQKTAIVMATGIDREEDEFILTSQIAIPQSSLQGKSTQAVQLVSRGRTVAEAFEQINAKTGWYPKLVFCKLILLGEKAAKENVFDALDFFLLDEYLSDSCQVAVCEGYAKDILNTAALVDPSSSVAIGKVLSAHAERVGDVHPASLKNFAIGYFGDSKSGLLPVIEIKPQQEEIGSSSQANEGKNKTSPTATQSSKAGKGFSLTASQAGETEQGDNQNGQEGKSSNNKPVFSAKQTALFVDGKWKSTLTPEETFAVNAASGKMRLANYSVDLVTGACSLVVKRNDPKIKLSVGKEGQGAAHIRLTITAGLVDYSKSVDVDKIKDVGDVPDGAFAAAEKKLAAEIRSAYEKARGVGCDLFGLTERLVKYKNRAYRKFLDGFLANTTLSVEVKFVGVR